MMMEVIEPMLLSPAGKDYLWGGTRLKTDYGKVLALDPLAETWECSTHQDGESIIASGSFAGKSLAQVLREYPVFLGTRHQGKEGLPILVKLIDAAKNLSIQVHPDDEYAQAHENDNGKTELWYVLDAVPGATLIYGFEHDVTAGMLLAAARTGEIEKHLHRRSVFRGDVLYISPGTVHAIGAGVLLVEIQQSSNVTYRVYDYNRVDKSGKKRELHLAKALDVLDMKAVFSSREDTRRARLVQYYPGYAEEILCRCPYFEVKRFQINGKMTFAVDDSSFQVMLCIGGCGQLSTVNEAGKNSVTEKLAEQRIAKKTLTVKKGDCVFFPAGLGKCEVAGEMSVVWVRC